MIVVKPEITDEIDLHNFKPSETSELINEYIFECIKKKISMVRIIHGKGKGHLRRKVHKVLQTNKYVKKFYLATPNSGAWGATIAVLEKNDISKT